MNHLASIGGLANRYYALRHGRSEANRRGIIVSSPQAGATGFGLTREGRQQVRQGLRASPLGAPAAIYCSHFLRALETAEIARELLGAAAPVTAGELQERWFGVHEGAPARGYETVWAHDRQDPGHATGGVESALHVLERTTRLVRRLERLHRGEVVLLVSHGDPLQILECGFRGWCPSRHRSLPPLETGEVRELRRAVS